MRRVIAVLLVCFSSFVWSQAFTLEPAATSDSQALSLVQQSLEALGGAATISDVALHANVTSILSSDNETRYKYLPGQRNEREPCQTQSQRQDPEMRNLVNGLLAAHGRQKGVTALSTKLA